MVDPAGRRTLTARKLLCLSRFPSTTQAGICTREVKPSLVRMCST